MNKGQYTILLSRILENRDETSNVSSLKELRSIV